MTTTVRAKPAEIYKDWHVIDAADRPLGRVATEAAMLLRGKHKPTYEPHLDDGDFVIIVNAAKVRVTGRKSEQMTYYRHSGYPGGLKSRSYTQMLERFPDRIIERAVKGMLPGGPLGKAMARHLKVYRGPKHPHESQVVGSERAKATREALFAEFPARDRVAPKLRPLPGTKAQELDVEAVVEVAPETEEAPRRARFRRGIRASEAAAQPAAEQLTEAAVMAEPVEEVLAEREVEVVAESGTAPPVAADEPEVSEAETLTEAAVMAQPAESVTAADEGPPSEADGDAAESPTEAEPTPPTRRPSRRRTRTQE